jgi:hypothetical protein
MRRRSFILFVGGATAWPLAVRAQRAAASGPELARPYSGAGLRFGRYGPVRGQLGAHEPHERR